MKIYLFKKIGGYEDIIIQKKNAGYENTFIVDFPEPEQESEPEPEHPAKKGWLRLHYLLYKYKHSMICGCPLQTQRHLKIL